MDDFPLKASFESTTPTQNLTILECKYDNQDIVKCVKQEIETAVGQMRRVSEDNLGIIIVISP